MRIAYLDCFAGISGDMFLGALLDAGVPESVLTEAVAALGLDASLRIEKVDRSGISSIKVHVLEGGKLAEGTEHTHDHLHTHRHEDTHMHAHGSAPKHAHEHEHTHEDAHTHTHEHEDLHTHDHSHDPERKHSHDPEHKHSHDPEHKHSHEHEHKHSHDPEQKHSHEHEHKHAHGRSLTQIRRLIEVSSLAPAVKEFAHRTFQLLGHAEAKIHNVPVDEIHFHEVGAVDAIVDIVAAAAGIDSLHQQEPVDWFCSPLNVGGGMVECAHGTFPVPAPATADLLRGMPTYSAHVQKELVTPTGAALLRALMPTFGTQPPMRVHSIGYGAGTRNPKGFPNVLRLSIGETEAVSREQPKHTHVHQEASVMVLETALDDATPQLLAHVAERALEAGALDVMLTPVVMKKGRAATLLTVLCDPAQTTALEHLLLRETTTLGIRKHREERSCLDRRHTTVSTEYGDLRVKVGLHGGQEWNAMPEYEDCRAAARQHDVSLKQVMQAAVAAYALSPVR